MSATISVSCPKCKKTIKAPATLKGKKIRCKGCGQTFPVVEDKADDEEWGVIKSYGVDVEKEKIRCPFCAHELENDDDVLCMNCGYNLQTRDRLQSQVLEPISGQDYFLWHLPAGLCCLAIIGLIVFLIMVWGGEPSFGDNFDWLQDKEWARIYTTVICLALMWPAGYYAFKRFVLNPHPPAREKRKSKKEEEED